MTAVPVVMSVDTEKTTADTATAAAEIEMVVATVALVMMSAAGMTVASTASVALTALVGISEEYTMYSLSVQLFRCSYSDLLCCAT